MKRMFSIGGVGRIVWASCISTAVFVGCGQKSEAPTGSPQAVANQSAKLAVRSIADLQRLLIPGMLTNEIVVKLGEPNWTEKSSENETLWGYTLPSFPADDEMRGAYVEGLVMGITNQHLAYWGCSYVSIQRDHIVRREAVLPSGSSQPNSPSVNVFVVSSDRIADGRFIDTERFPKLGYIPLTPSLRISAVKEVTLEERTPSGSENQNRTVWAFGIFLTQEDAARFKSMTATNVSNKVLVVIGDEPVSAPTIVAPLETGSFVIDCRDRMLMETVKKQLANMPRQN